MPEEMCSQIVGIPSPLTIPPFSFGVGAILLGYLICILTESHAK